MTTSGRVENSPSIATTIAVTLSVSALLVGVAVFAAVVSDDEPAPAVEEPAAAPAATVTAESLIDFSAAWDDAFVARDAAIAPAPDQTVHEIAFSATEIEIEVAPGVTQLMWTFNDQVPGPTLRGNIGDIFRITLTNDGVVPHSIDFHASKVAWNDEMRSIAPGESIVYEYEAKHSGIFMYHCGTGPALHHIGMGMYGTIIIDPPDLAPVDHEYVFVQSELYEAAEGEVADYQKMLDEDWDAIVFNGAVNQYRDRPIQVEVGDRVRAWVMDDGPSENSSFHIVGTIFDTAFKEGVYLLQPDESRGGAQALDLQPAQGGFVEFTFDEEGLYPIVTHKFANVPKGALGLFQAGDGEPDARTPVIGADGLPVTEDATAAPSH
ncbi:MAG: multicopper oxidase domain-containing protein [Actinomycetota bacterium]|nr:multicopper oxidase domain-containing protein [Actinomycetota bacterium]